MSVIRLASRHADEAIAVLVAAFRDYPVMRFVIGEVPPGDYDRRLQRLVRHFNLHRFARRHPVLGAVRDGRILGVASLDPPVPNPLPADVEAERRETWRGLGAAAHARFLAFAEAANEFEPAEPHYSLGMLGVLPGETGRGHSRRLLDAVHALSAGDAGSCGVALTTENPDNLPLYRHFGYELVGERDLGGLRTWGFYRRDPAG